MPLLILYLLCLCLPMNAYAYLGKIGSPVVPSYLPKPAPAKSSDDSTPPDQPEPSATQNEAPAPRQPLLTIDFNQRHIYFEPALRQAIGGVEANKAGVSYDLVSTTPSGNTPSQNVRNTDDAGQNIADVLAALSDLGVGAARVHVTSLSSDTATAQQIAIFIRE